MKNVYLSHFSVVINPGENKFLPYSCGTLWSYAQSQPDIVEKYQLGNMFFEKDTNYNNIIDQLDNPVVFGMSCYVWNANYNDNLAKLIKERYPECLIVYGGPHIPATSDDTWWDEHPFVDVVVYYEGEKVFVELLRCTDRAEMAQLTNVCVNFGSHWTYSNDAKSERIRNLEVIPSPYTTNLFKNVQKNHATLIETHRGCPYACTFCDWGSLTYTKVTKYGMDRIREDIEWAGKNKIGFLYNVDANFGLFKERDNIIVDILIETKEKYGYPKMFFVNWAKNANEEVIQMAKKLYDAKLIKAFIMSLQTLTPLALELIKRDNMDSNKYTFFANRCKELGLPLDCELILGNPGETIDGWKHTYLTLADFDQLSTQIMPLAILPGAELATKENRELFEIETFLKPFPGVGDSEVPEYMEQIKSTKWLSEDDIKYLAEWTWCARLGHEFNLMRDFANYVDTHNIVDKTTFYDKWYEYVKTSTGLINRTFKKVAEKRIKDGAIGNALQSMEFRQHLTFDNRDETFQEIDKFTSQFDIDENIRKELLKYCNVRLFNIEIDYPFQKTFKYNFIDDVAETITLEFTSTLFGAYSTLGQNLLEGSDTVIENYKFRSGLVCSLTTPDKIDIYDTYPLYNIKDNQDPEEKQHWLDEVYKKDNNELYDKWKNYHKDVIGDRGWKCHILAAKWIIDNFPEGTEVGDIGCGNGQVGLELMNHKYLIDGYDLNQPMLDRFVTNNYRHTKKLDITKESLSKKYKCLTAMGVLTFGHVDASASKNIADSLTDDGLLFCSMCIYPADWIVTGGWLDQQDLEVVSIEKTHSLTTPEGNKQFHNMVVWRKKINDT